MQAGQTLDLLSKVDAHSVQVAHKVYVTQTPEDDNELGKLLCIGLKGDPVEFPCQSTIDKQKRTEA